MPFDAAQAIRLGSSLLYLLVGLVILAVARRRGPIALGALMVLFGGQGLWLGLEGSSSTVRAFAQYAADLALVPCYVGLALWMPSHLTRAQRWAAPVGLASGIASLVWFRAFGSDFSAILATYATIPGVPSGWAPAFMAVNWLATVAQVAMVVTLSMRVALVTPTDRAGFVRYAAVLGVQALYYVFWWPRGHPTSLAVFASTLILVLGMTVPWLVAAARSQSRFPLAIALVWPAMGLFAYGYFQVSTAAVHQFQDDPWGMYGVMSFVGWIVVVYAILRADLLGVKLPRFAVNRGVVAASALAALFIVAQIAQNFLSAEYGLLTGGVIAGVVLFAANPVQKAIERVTERKGTPTSVPADDHDVRHRREDVYLAALRLAMRDRTLTRDEEVHLHRLAEELGIGAGRAHELMVAVEGERAKGRRRA